MDKENYILQSKIDFAIEKLKNNEACGIDEILTELMKSVSEGINKELSNIWNEVYLNGEIIDDFKKDIIEAIPPSKKRNNNLREI